MPSPLGSQGSHTLPNFFTKFFGNGNSHYTKQFDDYSKDMSLKTNIDIYKAKVINSDLTVPENLILAPYNIPLGSLDAHITHLFLNSSARCTQ